MNDNDLYNKQITLNSMTGHVVWAVDADDMYGMLLSDGHVYPLSGEIIRKYGKVINPDEDKKFTMLGNKTTMWAGISNYDLAISWREALRGAGDEISQKEIFAECERRELTPNDLLLIIFNINEV